MSVGEIVWCESNLFFLCSEPPPKIERIPTSHTKSIAHTLSFVYSLLQMTDTGFGVPGGAREFMKLICKEVKTDGGSITVDEYLASTPYAPASFVLYEDIDYKRELRYEGGGNDDTVLDEAMWWDVSLSLSSKLIPGVKIERSVPGVLISFTKDRKFSTRDVKSIIDWIEACFTAGRIDGTIDDTVTFGSYDY